MIITQIAHTIVNIKGGDENEEISIQYFIYAAVLHALNNLDKDLLLVGEDDEMGRQLQDLKLITRKRAPRRKV